MTTRELIPETQTLVMMITEAITVGAIVISVVAAGTTTAATATTATARAKKAAAAARRYSSSMIIEDAAASRSVGQFLTACFFHFFKWFRFFLYMNDETLIHESINPS